MRVYGICKRGCIANFKDISFKYLDYKGVRIINAKAFSQARKVIAFHCDICTTKSLF